MWIDLILLQDLDLLLYISVPDKFIHNRRNTLFLQSLVPNKQPEEVEAAADSLQSVKIEDKEHSLEDISMSALMDLSLDDLRDLDKKVGLYDCQQQTRWLPLFSNKFPAHFLVALLPLSVLSCWLGGESEWVSDLFSCQITQSRPLSWWQAGKVSCWLQGRVCFMASWSHVKKKIFSAYK